MSKEMYIVLSEWNLNDQAVTSRLYDSEAKAMDKAEANLRNYPPDCYVAKVMLTHKFSKTIVKVPL